MKECHEFWFSWKFPKYTHKKIERMKEKHSKLRKMEKLKNITWSAWLWFANGTIHDGCM